jgi:hypothetical protein
MESSPPGHSPPGATSLTIGLCLFILALMAAAAAYGTMLAIRYYGRIGV